MYLMRRGDPRTLGQQVTRLNRGSQCWLSDESRTATQCGQIRKLPHKSAQKGNRLPHRAELSTDTTSQTAKNRERVSASQPAACLARLHMGGRIPPPWLNIPSRAKIGRQNIKRVRIIRKGLAPAGDKASMRALGAAAKALGKGATIPEDDNATT